jgi:hypothetical protein
MLQFYAARSRGIYGGIATTCCQSDTRGETVAVRTGDPALRAG